MVSEGVQLRPGSDVPQLQAPTGEGDEHLVDVGRGVAQGGGAAKVLVLVVVLVPFDAAAPAAAAAAAGPPVVVAAAVPSSFAPSEVQDCRWRPERPDPPPHQRAAEEVGTARRRRRSIAAHCQRRRRQQPVAEEEQVGRRRGGAARQRVDPLHVDAVALDDAVVAAGREGGVAAHGEGGDGARELRVGYLCGDGGEGKEERRQAFWRRRLAPLEKRRRNDSIAKPHGSSEFSLSFSRSPRSSRRRLNSSIYARACTEQELTSGPIARSVSLPHS